MTDLVCSYYTLSGRFPAGPDGSPHDFAARVRAAAEAGYTGMGLHFRDYAALRARGASDADLAAIVRDHGIRHVELEFLRDWHKPGEAGRDARRDEAALLHMAGVFGARLIAVGGDMEDVDLPPDRLVEPFRHLCERVGQAGVSVAIEPCIGSNVERLDIALDLLAAAGADNAGLQLDIWHSYRAGLDYAQLTKVDPALILAVQLNDVATEVQGTLIQDCVHHRLLPGEGDADAAGFVEAILRAGYAGPWGVEIVSKAQRRRPLDDAASASFNATISVIEMARARL